MNGVVYNLLSQSSLSINARFVFLSAGRCPIVNGVPLTYCWSHPGSYFGALSVQTAAGGRLELEAGSAVDGYTRVELNGQQLVGSDTNRTSSASILVSRSDSHTVQVQVGNYELSIENSDHFINLVAVRVLNWQQLTQVDTPHGLLGQTWSDQACSADKRRTRRLNQDGTMSLRHVIEGEVDDYAVMSDDMFGTDSVYNRFIQA